MKLVCPTDKCRKIIAKIENGVLSIRSRVVLADLRGGVARAKCGRCHEWMVLEGISLRTEKDDRGR